MLTLEALLAESSSPCACTACEAYRAHPCTCSPAVQPCPACRAHASPTGQVAPRRCAGCAALLTDRFAWCPVCRVRRQRDQRTLYLQRKQTGVCVLCTTPVLTGRTYCPPYMQRQTRNWPAAARARTRRIDAAKARGVCPAPRCGASVAGSGAVYCHICRAKLRQVAAAKREQGVSP